MPTPAATAQFGGNLYSDINQIESIGTSNYNSLQAVFRTSSWHGLIAQTSYTWGHNLDEVTAYRGALPQDSYNFKGDYGNSDFDTRNGFKGYVNYLIPSAPTMKLLTGGWEVNTAFALNGGQPITVYNGDDTSGTDEFTQRVNRVSNPFAGISHSIQTVNGSKFDAKKVFCVIKRIMDVVGSALALLLFAPVLLVIALAVKLTSKGPVFFRQKRVGQYGEQFVFLKFRSMYVNNDPGVHKEYVKQLIAGSAQVNTQETVMATAMATATAFTS